MRVNKKLLSVLSDFLINLAAGWIGSVFIIPIFSSSNIFIGWPVLTGDLIAGILCLYIAYKIKK